MFYIINNVNATVSKKIENISNLFLFLLYLKFNIKSFLNCNKDDF